MQTGADMTMVATSCNRHDLLARILVSEDGDADPRLTGLPRNAPYPCGSG